MSKMRRNKRPTFNAAALTMVVAVGIAPVGATAQAQREYLPLPAGAQPVAMPTEDYILQKAGENSYVVIAAGYQSTFVITQTGVVLLDAPPALAKALPVAIKSVTDKPVTHVIYTHDHMDHIGGSNAFMPAEIIAHGDTAKLLAIFPDSKRPAPTKTFSGSEETLVIGGVELKLIYPGPNHESGNIIIYVPQDKLAVMTDLVMPGWAPWRGWGNADHIPGILKAHDALLNLNFDTYVGGHVYRTGNRYDVETSRKYWVDLWKGVQSTMADTPYVPRTDGNAYAEEGDWFEAITVKVQARLVADWGKILGGVDTAFTHDTILAAVVSAATDTPAIPAEYLKDKP